MIEPTHKMVDGRRVNLTPIEVGHEKQRWADESQEHRKREQAAEKRKSDKAELLKKLSITEEECNLLRS